MQLFDGTTLWKVTTHILEFYSLHTRSRPERAYLVYKQIVSFEKTVAAVKYDIKCGCWLNHRTQGTLAPGKR